MSVCQPNWEAQTAGTNDGESGYLYLVDDCSEKLDNSNSNNHSSRQSADSIHPPTTDFKQMRHGCEYPHQIPILLFFSPVPDSSFLLSLYLLSTLALQWNRFEDATRNEIPWR